MPICHPDRLLFRHIWDTMLPLRHATYLSQPPSFHPSPAPGCLTAKKHQPGLAWHPPPPSPVSLSRLNCHLINGSHLRAREGHLHSRHVPEPLTSTKQYWAEPLSPMNRLLSCMADGDKSRMSLMVIHWFDLVNYEGLTFSLPALARTGIKRII